MKINKIIGLVLLIPPIIGVLSFLLGLVDTDLFYHIDGHRAWSGYIDYNRDGGGGGYSSPIPIYLGLMAIAGAYLIKEKE